MMTGYHNLTAVECENEVLRGRLKELKEAALALCDAVTRYVEPKKGDKYLGGSSCSTSTAPPGRSSPGGAKTKTRKMR